MTTLSTHVLDLTRGAPASGVSIRLLQAGAVLFEGVTDADGRCPELRALTLESGAYRLEFGIGAYFGPAGGAFLGVVPVEFGLSGAGHYHVPLLAAPGGYSTYRGS